MKQCPECEHNDWRFRTVGRETIATCKHCKHELKWVRKRKPKHDNKKCLKCKSKMEKTKVSIKPEVLLQPFYFVYVFRCPKCGREIPDKTTKRYNAMYT